MHFQAELQIEVCDYFHDAVTAIQGDPRNQWTEGWVGPRAVQGALENKKSLLLFPGHPTRSD